MESSTGVGVTAIFLAVVLVFATIVSRFFTEPLNQVIRKTGLPVTARLALASKPR
jgi:hypothetical protein